MLTRSKLSKDKHTRQKPGFSFDAKNDDAFKVYKLDQKPFEKGNKLLRGDVFPLKPISAGRTTPKALEGITFPA